MAVWPAPTFTPTVVAVATMNQVRDELNELHSALTSNIVQTDSFTGSVNNFALTTGVRVLYCTNATSRTYTGFSAGIDGQRLLVISKGAGQVDFSHQNAGSSASNRLNNIATSGPTSLAPGVGRAEFEYDATAARWQLLWHQQGGWITRTFAAGNYTASAGTWTVASSSRDAYWLRDRTLTMSFAASGTTSGTPVTVRIALPGYTAAASDGNPYYVSLNGAGAAEGGYWQVAAAGTTLNLQRYANATFAAGTVSGIGVATFEVQ